MAQQATTACWKGIPPRMMICSTSSVRPVDLGAVEEIGEQRGEFQQEPMGDKDVQKKAALEKKSLVTSMTPWSVSRSPGWRKSMRMGAYICRDCLSLTATVWRIWLEDPVLGGGHTR